MIDPAELDLLRKALAALADGFDELPPFTPEFDVDAVGKVLGRVAERMADNYPYHHPQYAGQMLKPPHAIARLAYALSLWLNPNNHALDGGRASSAMEKECIAELGRMYGWNGPLGHLTGGGTMANLEALWVAGRLHPGKRILASTQAHYTHYRISEVLGLPFDHVAAGADGTVYVSDSATQTIHRLKDGQFETWLTDAQLNSPNGLQVEKNRLLVASTGKFTQQGPVPDGQLLAVSLADKSITSVSGRTLGNLDGLEPDGDKGYYLTDWPAGKLLYLSRSGSVHELLSVEPGTADLEYIPARHLIVIPLMMGSKVVAYKVP
jgi:hypothetical protein